MWKDLECFTSQIYFHLKDGLMIENKAIKQNSIRFQTDKIQFHIGNLNNAIQNIP